MSRRKGSGDGGHDEGSDYDDFFDSKPEPSTPKDSRLSDSLRGAGDRSDHGRGPSRNDRRSAKSKADSKQSNDRGSERSSGSDNDSGRRKKVIEAKVPSSKYEDSGSDSDSYTTTASGSESDSDPSRSPSPSPKARDRTKQSGKQKSSDRTRDKSPRHKDDRSVAWSGDKANGAADARPMRPKSAHHTKRSHGQSSKDVIPEIKGYSDSESSSYTSSGTESDVTDVSPLGSPHVQSPHDYSDLSERARSGKPPKSPMQKDATYSSRSRPKSATSTESTSRLLKPDSDSMDLNLLMQAIIEMEKNKKRAERQKPRKQFVVPPPGGANRAAKQPKRNFSFSNDKVGDIDKENQRLMQEILKHAIAAKKEKEKARARSRQQTALNRMTTAGVNRKKEQQRIEQENLAMLKRLQTTKASKFVVKDDLLKDYSKKTLYGVNVESAHPPPSRRTPTRSPYEAGSTSSGMKSRTRSWASLRSDTASVVSLGSHRSSSTVASHASTVKSAGSRRRLRPTSASSATSGSHRVGRVELKTTRKDWEPGW